MSKSKEFSDKILKIVSTDSNISHFEAILEHCENNNIELEVVKKLCTPELKKILEKELTELKMIK